MGVPRGNLFVLSAPSGTGKTALGARLSTVVPNIRHSVSFTTRSPRAGELNGVHYTFVDETEFRSMVANGEFAEWAEVHGNFYGTAWRRIEELTGSGLDVLLDIDVQGARRIKQHFPDSVLVFIFPPSMDELQKRLKGRMSDSKEEVEKRLRKAQDEVREYRHYDYGIVNDDFDGALRALTSIIVAERARISRVDHNWVRENFLQED